jgi:hypothetical protein
MGRVVIASKAHYFLWVDPEWARKELLPLFDWDLDATRAAQAWQGLLSWGRVTAELLEALTPAAVQLASHLDEVGDRRKRYGSFIAIAAANIPDDPLAKPWFGAFLDRASDEDFAQFTWKVDKILESLQTKQKSEIWRNWLKRYLEHRIEFPPEPEADELTALFGWSFNLSEQLAELIEGLEALPGRGAAVKRLTWKLQQGELENSDPDLLARLVLALLNHCDSVEYWNLSPLPTVILRLHNENAHTQLIRELYEKYLEHGGHEDQELTKVVSHDDGGDHE